MAYKIFDGGDHLIFSLDGRIRKLKGSLWEPDAFATEPLSKPIVTGQSKEPQGVPVISFGGKKPFSIYLEGSTAYALADVNGDGTPEFSGVWGNGKTAEENLRTLFSA